MCNISFRCPIFARPLFSECRSFLISRLPQLPVELKRALLQSRYGLCLEYLKGPTLQVRLSGLMELGKAVHQVHMSYTQQHQQRQLFHMVHQKVRLGCFLGHKAGFVIINND